MNKLVILEPVYTVIALLFYTGGPLALLLSGGIAEGPNSQILALPDYSLIRQLFMLIYAITFLLVLRQHKKILYWLVKEKLTAVLIGVVLFSFFWSVAPPLTLKRDVAFLGTALFGIYFAVRYDLKQQLHLLAWTFALVIGFSITFAILLPHYGIMMSGFHSGAWRGIYTHKNGLGAMMALSTAVFLPLAIDTKRSWILWLCLGLSLFLLIMSRSSSPLIHVFIIIFSLLIFPILRWSFITRAFVLSLSSALGYGLILWLVTQAETIAGFFGKDLTLTGRTDLWLYAWGLIQQRPWFGYGYAALWFDWDSPTHVIWRAVGWKAPSSHNGFIELWLALGLIGIAVFLLHFWVTFSRMINLASHKTSYIHFFPLFLMLLTILTNITEAPLLANNAIYTVLYISSAITSCMTLKSKLIFLD